MRKGIAEGPLLGGCLESLEHLRGTRFWPDWRGSLLFLESSEEKPSPERWDSLLMDYENMGVFEQIAGLLIGRPYGYDDAKKTALREVVSERTAAFGFPVLADLDFGHTSPHLTLPLGVRARLDATRRELSLVEAAVI